VILRSSKPVIDSNKLFPNFKMLYW